jgi:hypothetical protein
MLQYRVSLGCFDLGGTDGYSGAWNQIWVNDNAIEVELPNFGLPLEQYHYGPFTRRLRSGRM